MGDDSVVLARFSRKVEPEPQHTADTVKTSNADTKSETSCESNGYPVWKQTETSKDEEEIEACGWGHLTISQCQKFRDPRWFLVVITLCGACQGMAINGFVNTAISTLEKRFEISSTETGLIASCYDIMFVLLVIPISYFGGQGNKPRYLGIGIFILGLGSFVFSLPHFLSGQYVVENAQETTCIRPDSAGNVSQTVVDPCESNLPSTLSNYKYFFFLGQLLHGAGATSLYTLGVVYLDENVSPRSSSLYNGIFYTGAVIGPAIGFILGSEFLSIFTEIGVDADRPKSISNSPKYIGNNTKYIGNSPKDITNGLKDIGNSPKDIGNSTKPISNSQKDIGNISKDIGNKAKDIGNSPKCIGNSTKHTVNSTKHTVNSTKHIGNTQKDIGNKAKDNGNSPKHIGNSTKNTAKAQNTSATLKKTSATDQNTSATAQNTL
ncbi:solute carrier organic anion transporter family member [Plakobranchus ocellatus]|uniref:Solute carrier organic anion transporter family member n=1 Tax=Plakobranchus ocellatus TaxID=259542 RepID=A0AAV4DLL3_9GAST|nr:solute carrier organic anion transporter family member [Plakobranchus ocellatus]